MTERIHEDFWAINPVFITNTQTFTSPGTWTKPPTTTWVEVLVVGGGGGGGGYSPTPPTGSQRGGGGGGGGSVIRRWLPVTGPVPVTVGAGGTRFIYVAPPGTSTAATGGGTSYFGAVGPPTPPTTVQATGGQRGYTGQAPGYTLTFPPDGFGISGFDNLPGGYGTPGGGARSTTGHGAAGYGGGGNSPMRPFFSLGGAGGPGVPSGGPATTNGTDGQAGAVIVRWKE